MKIIVRSEIFSKSRILKGLSQRELARQTGLSHAYISLMERSIKSIGPAAAKRISIVLDVPMEELFLIK